ncbi:hypothetical protein M8J77_018960 [Diaphorina citri]|nr:hypothetical protein M8J77_018960 [Diaphorina citri]
MLIMRREEEEKVNPEVYLILLERERRKLMEKYPDHILDSCTSKEQNNHTEIYNTLLKRERLNVLQKICKSHLSKHKAQELTTPKETFQKCSCSTLANGEVDTITKQKLEITDRQSKSYLHKLQHLFDDISMDMNENTKEMSRNISKQSCATHIKEHGSQTNMKPTPKASESSKTVDLVDSTVTTPSMNENNVKYSKMPKTPKFTLKRGKKKRKIKHQKTAKKSSKNAKPSKNTPRLPRNVNNKTGPTKKLYFAMAANSNLKLRTCLKQNNWIQRKFQLTKTEPQLNRINNTINKNHLVLIRNSYPSASFWADIDDSTVVNCFPRSITQCSGGLNKRLCIIDWVFSDDVSPSTFLIKNVEDSKHNMDIFNFMNEYLSTACVNVLKFTLVNSKTLFTPDAVHGTIPMWILSYALENCQGMLLSHEEYYSAIAPQHIAPHAKQSVKTTKKKRKQQELILDMIDKQYKFVQYYYLLLNEGQLFEKGTDEFLRTMLETVRAKLKQLEPDYLQAMETEQFSSSENLEAPTIHSVPMDNWIVKSDVSKHYGIRCFKKLQPLLDEIDKNEYKCDYYVIQRAVSDQFLIHGKQFKIYKFFLVVNVEPPEILPFKLCYFLINQRKEKECIYELEKYQHVWTPHMFETYLSSVHKHGLWARCIHPQMLESIVKTMSLNKQFLVQRDKSLELVRTTFILDSTLKPWLINIKSNTNKFARLPGSEHIISKMYKYILAKLGLKN